ncbi:branched-chain amino acid ABC transporter permease [Streptomyces sp. CNQ-509]|uniref:branched-chain amino acid ABC transporter permease n=1 Tax=unclassified Streptomyces TaxID=2593676 RepID=UPI00062DE58A|nr:branched-chain amino acid ABC transporter permease [Streptomyces sp. CNQ-509]AKH80884.1 branched-chain amino acid ABC transporter permease [Streptomyces sp. CNQ-509]
MDTFLTHLAGGLALGAIYALLALGLVVVFKATGVLNFAHPGMVMAAGLVTWQVTDLHAPFVVAVLAGVCAAAAIGVVLELLTSRAVAAQAVVTASVITLGAGIMLQAEINRRLGSRVLDLDDPWGSGVLDIGGLSVAESRAVAITVTLVVVAALFTWLRVSSWGIAARAATEDRETARLMAIPLRRITLAAWALAGLLAGIAVLFLTAFPSPGLDSSTATVALRALPAAIIGGLDSLEGAVLGGFLVGTCEVLAQGYQSRIDFLGQGFSSVVPYVLMMALLLARPAGLFGTREVTRV